MDLSAEWIKQECNWSSSLTQVPLPQSLFPGQEANGSTCFDSVPRSFVQTAALENICVTKISWLSFSIASPVRQLAEVTTMCISIAIDCLLDRTVSVHIHTEPSEKCWKVLWCVRGWRWWRRNATHAESHWQIFCKTHSNKAEFIEKAHVTCSWIQVLGQGVGWAEVGRALRICLLKDLGGTIELNENKITKTNSPPPNILALFQKLLICSFIQFLKTTDSITL